MKKILFSLALLGMIVGISAPLMASAQMSSAPTECTMRREVNDFLGTGAACPSAGTVAEYDQNYGTPPNELSGAMCCLFSTILYVIDWLFMILMVIVVVLILMGAFTLMTSGGSEEGVAKGRNYIIYALIGVAVALLSRALPYLIRSFIGV
jgi:hypothetical protein